MCRLFGFRSIIQSQVHRSLVHAENALAVQSRKHSDGWGVAYYIAGNPHVIKSVVAAIEDQIFKHVSGVVASQTVVAHLRKATVGDVNTLNAHPFQFGRWIFAHNGEIARYALVRDRLRTEVTPDLRRFILGDTDSEVAFYLFLTLLSQRADLHDPNIPFDTVAEALAETAARIREVADLPQDDLHSKLTFILTDGRLMLGLRSRMPLRFSTWKSRCRDRGFCPHLSPECEAPSHTGRVNHFLLASEELQGNNVWIELPEDSLIGVDDQMHLRFGTLHGAAFSPALPPEP